MRMRVALGPAPRRRVVHARATPSARASLPHATTKKFFFSSRLLASITRVHARRVSLRARVCRLHVARASVSRRARARRHHTHRHHTSHSTHFLLVVDTSHLPSHLPSTIVPTLESRSVTSNEYINTIHPRHSIHYHPRARSSSRRSRVVVPSPTVRCGDWMWINPRRMPATMRCGRRECATIPMATMFASERASARVFRPRARYASTMTTRPRCDRRGCDAMR